MFSIWQWWFGCMAGMWAMIVARAIKEDWTGLAVLGTVIVFLFAFLGYINAKESKR